MEYDDFGSTNTKSDKRCLWLWVVALLTIMTMVCSVMGMVTKGMTWSLAAMASSCCCVGISLHTHKVVQCQHSQCKKKILIVCNLMVFVGFIIAVFTLNERKGNGDYFRLNEEGDIVATERLYNVDAEKEVLSANNVDATSSRHAK